MMEAGQQCEVGIMEQRCLEPDRRSRRAPAKKIHRAALAHELYGCFPDLRLSHRLNHGIERDAGLVPNFRNKVLPVPDVDYGMSPQPRRRLQPRRAPAGHSSLTAEMLCKGDK